MTDDYRFEVAIPFGTESYRNPAYLPDWLNPWRYRARHRLCSRVENTADDQWDEWNLTDDTVPGEFTPYIARIGQTDDGAYIYHQICKVDISASDEDDVRARLEDGLRTVVDEYTIRPFESERFAAQVGSAQFDERVPI